MKFKYLIPFFGILFTYNDIPHTPDEYTFKPLHGDSAIFAHISAWLSTIVFCGIVVLFITA